MEKISSMILPADIKLLDSGALCTQCGAPCVFVSEQSRWRHGRGVPCRLPHRSFLLSHIDLENIQQILSSIGLARRQDLQAFSEQLKRRQWTRRWIQAWNEQHRIERFFPPWLQRSSHDAYDLMVRSVLHRALVSQGSTGLLRALAESQQAWRIRILKQRQEDLDALNRAVSYFDEIKSLFC